MIKVMENKTLIKIEGQDNNVAEVIDTLQAGKSLFFLGSTTKYVGVELYGLTDNPRWFGADIHLTGDTVSQKQLDLFRIEFPNVNAEVAE
jgi:hypothetical protein